MKKYIKIIVRHLFSLICRLLYSKPLYKPFPENEILIIRLDGIGDYILFRNMLQFLREDAYYSKCKITLMCDSAVYELAKVLDNKYIDKFIVFNRKKFLNNLSYANNFLKNISQNQYSQIISPAFGRTLFFTDTFVKLIHAKEKIGSLGDFTDITVYQKNIGNKWYTRIIEPTKKIIFEYYRNIEFFEKLLNKRYVGFKLPYIHNNNNKKESFIIALGASERFRKWSAENYAKTAEYVYKKFNLSPILLGGKSEIKDSEEFLSYFPYKCLNLVGKVNLIETLNILSSAYLVISNESGLAHIACAVGSENILVLSNGNNIGRFAPYPPDFKNYKLILHPKIKNKYNDIIKNEYAKRMFLNINDIKADTVIDTINNLIN